MSWRGNEYRLCAREWKKRRSLTFLTNLFTARFNSRSILFYSILFYSILFCSVLFYSILFYSILFYSQRLFLFFIKISEQASIFFLHYSGRAAPLTSKRCILYIYSTNIGTEYFKHGIYSPFYPLQNTVCFIILKYLILVLLTFYIQDVLKLKKKYSCSKRLMNSLADKVQTRSHPKPFEIFGGKYDNVKGFSPITGVLEYWLWQIYFAFVRKIQMPLSLV